MSTSESGRYALLDQLAEEFAARLRVGERPSLKEYVERFPDLADDIRELFPAMIEIERADEQRQLAAEPPPPPRLEQLGDYRILREIGQGGMGVVYEAEQLSLGRHVALKVLPARMLPDARARRRFEREARAAARLHHTNIVPVFGVGEHEGTPYYVMQFIQGLGIDLVLDELKKLKDGGGDMGQVASLPASDRLENAKRQSDVTAFGVARSLLSGEFHQAPLASSGGGAKGGEPPDGKAAPSSPVNPVGAITEVSAISSGSITLPGHSGEARKSVGKKKQTYWQSVANLGVQVADALEYVHKQGIVHRDVKPSNLLLDVQGTVWVTDLGLAKADDQQNLTDVGDVLGTLRYLSPEAFEGKADARSDVYSLGLTLYELLAFRPAFDEKDRPTLVRQVTSAEAVRLGKVNPEVPRDLQTIVHKAISRDPAQRYQSASDLAGDLQRFLDDEPIRARPVSLAEVIARWARHNKGMAAALAGLALLLMLLLAGSLLAAAYFQTLEQAQHALAQKNERLADERESARQEAESGRKREASLRKEAEDAGLLVQEREKELRRNLYRAEMILAGQAADFPSGIGRAGELLAPWRVGRPDLRDWEWYYLNSLCHQDLLTLRGHSRPVHAVAWSRDGKRLASAGADGTIRVWDSSTGAAQLTLRGHAGAVHSVAWSRDGKRLASAGEDRTVKVWEVAQGKEAFILKGASGPVYSVAWSPDGTRLVSGGLDRTVRVWDAANGKIVRPLHAHIGPVTSVAFSPDGARLASASRDTSVKVWDLDTGKNIHTLMGDKRYQYSVAWSPDGKRLASAGEDLLVRVWDADTGKETHALRGHTHFINSVAWDPDSSRLASASLDQTARVWDLESGKESLALRGHTNGLRMVAWSPDGARLASASLDQTVKVWDAATSRHTLVLRGHEHPLRSVVWSPDGTRLASAGMGPTVKVWDATTGKPTLTLRGHHTLEVRSLAWSADGTRLASTGWGDGLVVVWDVADGKQALPLRGHAALVSSVSWAPDGRRLASVDWTGKVLVWDPATGKQTLTSQGQVNSVHALAWSPDGTRLAVTNRDFTVRVWDAGTGKEKLALRGHTDWVIAVAWSRDGKRLASASEDRTLKVWDAGTGKELITLRGHTDWAKSVAWSPDGARLASASQDGTIRVWDPADGKETLTLRGRTGGLNSVAWSPDGTRLASVGEDATVVVHDATIGLATERSPRLLAILDRRIAANPRNAKDRRLRAEIHARQAEWDNAAADVERYLLLSEDQPRWHTAGCWAAGPHPAALKASPPPEGSMSWQAVPQDANGLVNLGSLFGGSEPISAYVQARVYSLSEQPATVLVGSSGPCRLWHNGKAVHETASRSAADAPVAVTLRAGWNTLLAQAAQGSDEHVLTLRLSDEPAEKKKLEK